MIGYLSGTVSSIFPEGSIIINVNGVGYLVNIATNELAVNEEDSVALFIYTHVTENDISLWGFKFKEELHVFKKLISVSGVGTKSAVSMLQTHGFRGIVKAVIEQEVSGVKASGIGQKTAQKILLDLKGKLDDLIGLIDMSESKQQGTNLEIDKQRKIVSGLESLGYRNKDILDELAKLVNESANLNESSEQQIITMLLQRL